MHKTPRNLLPEERRRALGAEYAVRLLTVALALATALVAIAATLLVPAYALGERNVREKSARLAQLEAAADAPDETALAARLAVLAGQASTIADSASARSASATIGEALVVPRPGIALSGFAYAASGVASAASTLAVSGTARTRDALRAYQLALEGASFAASVDLPVSTYAQGSDIPFTMTVTLAP